MVRRSRVVQAALLSGALLTACATLVGLDGDYEGGGVDPTNPEAASPVDEASDRDGAALDAPTDSLDGGDAGDAADANVRPCEAGVADGGGCREDIVDVAVGASHACAIRRSGELYCVGGNDYGQLGRSTNQNSNLAFDKVVVTDGLGAAVSFTQVSAGGTTTCAAASNGDGYCWGRNSEGQLGNVATMGLASVTPVRVDLTERILSIAAGGWHACAIVDVPSGSNVRCWGAGAVGQLGNAALDASTQPVVVATTIRATRLISGDGLGDTNLSATCADTATGPKCWGVANSGALGSGAALCGASLSCFPSPSDWGPATTKQVSFGYLAACGLGGDGGVGCRGLNRFGVIGSACTETSALTPKAMPAGVVPVELAYRATHACVRTGAGEVWCWGNNVRGEIGARVGDAGFPTAEPDIGCGAGVTVPRRVLKADGSPMIATRIAIGNGTTVAIGADGRLWGWGNSELGMLGFNQPVAGGCTCSFEARPLPDLPPTMAP